MSLLSSQKEVAAAFDRKTESVTEGLQPYVSNYFKILGIINSTILADYIIAARSESNISDNYKKEIIKDLFKLSEFFSHEKSYKEITREDLLLYLNSLRKPEPLDPLHKWIGTYNLRLGIFQSFFKWLLSMTAFVFASITVWYMFGEKFHKWQERKKSKSVFNGQ